MKIHEDAERPLLYISGPVGGVKMERKLWDVGVRYRCFSYVYVAEEGIYYAKAYTEGLDYCLKHGIGVMMDSSAHSFHNYARKKHVHGDTLRKMCEEVALGYVKYVKKFGKGWDFYVTFDYVRDCPTIYAMQKKLEKRGIQPVPVFHGDQSIDWFRRYCKEGHKLICIGKMPRSFRETCVYYDLVFNEAAKHGVLLHGLQQTALNFMFLYPWYSVDSTSWVKYGAYGMIMHIDYRRHKVGSVHITKQSTGSAMTDYSSLPKHQRTEVVSQVKENGFDFKELQQDNRKRALYNAFIFCNKFSELKEVISRGRTRWKSLLS